MRLFKHHQKGFSIVEGLFIILVITAIGAGSWLVYQNHHKKLASLNQTKTAASLYSGWKSYCSSYGGLCLKYPANWKLTAHMVPAYTQDSSGSFAKSGTVGEVVIADPANTIGIVYIPSNPPPPSAGNPGITTVVEATPIVAAKIMNQNALYVIKAYEAQFSTVQEGYFVTTAQSAIAQDNMLQLGTHKPSGGDLIENAAYFRNIKSAHPNDLQQLFISSLPQDLAESTFTSIKNAQTGFNLNAVRTSGQILASTSYDK